MQYQEKTAIINADRREHRRGQLSSTPTEDTSTPAEETSSPSGVQKKNDGQKGDKLEINFKGGPYTIAEDMGRATNCTDSSVISDSGLFLKVLENTSVI